MSGNNEMKLCFILDSAGRCLCTVFIGEKSEPIFTFTKNIKIHTRANAMKNEEKRRKQKHSKCKLKNFKKGIDTADKMC